MVEEKLKFGSDAAVQELRCLARQVELCQASVVETKRRQALVHENIGMLELNGKVPKQEIASARQVVQNAEGALQRAKSDLNSAFLAGRRDFDVVRGEVINSFRQSTIEPMVCQIRKSIEDVEAAINRLVEQFSLTEISDEDGQLDAFDQGILSWNSLVAQLAGPGNAMIDSSDSARLALSNLILSAAREFVKVEASTKRLREAANAMQGKLRLKIRFPSSKV